MKILRAAEDYLEAMLMMQKKHGYIRHHLNQEIPCRQ